ncbi:MAG TPA: AsmA family protein [Bryobacteraceae bacterium]|nr:AsmA family protein [Bryobacteraceae bacterium]
MKRLWRWLAIAVIVVVAVGLTAPRVSANRFRPRIQAALEAALNRPVELGAVHLNLFTGPGFSVDNVLIDEDPAVGIEPFAHVESLEARIRWTSLFSGHLAFSSLRLENPSVNVVKLPGGPWNIQALVDRPTGGISNRRQVPDIQIRGGRIDFKFGDTKSVFYISDADVDAYPNESGEVVIRFSGAPARTDQSSRSFGALTARGLLQPDEHGENRLSMGVHLDRTPISEIARLFHGSDIGVHGYVLANAKLAGPLSKVDITGDLNISDVHRWDLMPTPGEGWTLNYRGLLNLTGHHLELTSLQTASQPDPVSVEFRLDDYLAAPKWSSNLGFRDLPAASLVEIARHFGAPFPQGVQVEGKIQGGIGYSSQSGAGGQLELSGGAVKLPQGASAAANAIQVDSAQVQIAGGKVVLAPSQVEMPDGQSAQVEGEYALDASHVGFRISARKLTASAASFLEGAPLLDQLHEGSWKGWIAYEKTAADPAAWSGQYDLQNAVVEIPGLASPVHLAAASVQMNDDGIQVTRMRGHAGGAKFEGDYRYSASAAHPHRLRLTIPELQLSDLESLMLPALHRNEGFLARAFRRDLQLPKWLEERDADVSLHVSTVMNGDLEMGDLTARGIWRGSSITVPDLSWSLEGMHASGKMTVSLAKAEPAYELSGTMENFDYKNGQLDIAGDLQTHGLGSDLLLNLRSKGTFSGRGIMLAPDSEVREVSGAYRLSTAVGAPRLTLSNVQLLQGGDTLVGQGASQPDGRIVLELASGRKQVRLTGMLLPLHPEPAPAR